MTIVVYVFGHLSLLIVKQDHSNTAKSLSLKLFTGIILQVSLFAIFKTHGNTIYSGLVLLLLFILYYYKRTQKISLANIRQNSMFFEFKELLYLIVVISIMVSFFSFLFGRFFDHSEGLYDFSYYAALSNTLNIHGIESTQFYSNMPGNTLGSSPVFYHYFELWFTAIVKSLFNISSFNALMYIVQPFFFSLIILLAKSYIVQNKIGKTKFVLLVVPFLIIITSSNAKILNIFLAQDHLRFITTQLVYYFNIKLSVVYLCIFWFILNKENSWFERLIPLGILCFIYPTTLPAIVVGSICFLLYLRFIEKKPFSWISLLYILIPAIYIAIFYSIQYKDVQGINSVGVSSIIVNKIVHYSILDLKKIIGDTFYFYGAYLLFLLPLYLILKDNRIKLMLHSYKLTLIFVLILFVITTVAHSVTFGIWDADQFQYNLFFPIFNIICFLLLIQIVEKHINIFLLFVILNLSTLYIYLNSIYQYKALYNSTQYMILDNEFSNKLFSSAYIKNKSSYKGRGDSYLDMKIPFSYLRRHTDSYYPVCLSVFEIPKSHNDIESELIGQNEHVSPFYRFVGDTAGKSIDSLKMEYLKRYKIDYLFIEKGNLFYKELGKMPIEKRISFDNEPYDIIKFNWK